MEQMTVGELIQKDEFVSNVDKLIKQIVKERLLRPLPKPGYRYKRDWYDQMS